MPFVPPRHTSSTSPSGAAALPLGSRTTDLSSSTDTSTEDEVVYLRTQKPVQEEKDWDTSDEEGHKPRAVALSSTSMRGISKTPVANDDEGFTPVPIVNQNRKYRRSQASQKQRNPTLLAISTTLREQTPPDEIQLTQRPDEYSISRYKWTL